MKKASTKDIFRTIWKEKKRFFSIMMITVLGVTMMTGLEAGCRDLKLTADQFYDLQKLFDVSVMSTLGLTDEDVNEIQAMEGVEKAEGTFSEIVHTKKGERNQTAEVKTFREDGLNVPYVIEGRLPVTVEEIAVSENYLKETGKTIGDTLTIEEILEEDEEEADREKTEEETEETKGSEFHLEVEDSAELEEEETPNFPITAFTIVGSVIDATDINNSEGSASFRATLNADYTFFVLPEAVESEVYTAVYVSLEGTQELLCYSQEYEERIETFVEKIEAEIMQQREEARYQQVTGEAYDKIEEKEREMQDAFAEIEQEFEENRKEIRDGWKEVEDGYQKIADGKKELEEQEQKAKEEIADAREQLEDAYIQLCDAWVQLNDAEKQLGMAAAELEAGKEQLRLQEAEAKKQLEEAEAFLNSKIFSQQSQKAELQNNLEQIKGMFGNVWSAENTFPVNGNLYTTTMENAWNEYVAAVQTVVMPIISSQMDQENSNTEEEIQNAIQAALTEAMTNNPEYSEKLVLLSTFLNGLLQQIPGGGNVDPQEVLSLASGIGVCNATEQVLTSAKLKFEEQKAYALAQIEGAWAKIEEGEKELEEGRAKLSAGRGEVIDNYQKWQEGVQELEEKEQEALQKIADAKAELADGEQELADGKQELLDGERELEDYQAEYREEKEKAEGKIEEAKQKVSDMDMTKWYVQDRNSLSGYVNVDSDTECIESLATVFTMVFFVVAILISLTTVTRMVEEERGLIGTYKALGFTDGEIRRKYTLYALGASVLGAVLGDVGGFLVLPEILFVFFKVMYLFPAYQLQFETVSGIASGVVFILGIAGAAMAACYSELKYMPAHLMRPKAPKEGSRVFLEYIRPLWKRMSFLNKVTARNLFRYKKRMFMTLFGIMGCTALLVFGLAIKDSVEALMPMQYEDVYCYDLLAAVNAEDNAKLLSYMEESTEVTKYLNIQVESIKLKNADRESEKVQLMIFPDGADISEYFTLKNENEEPIVLGKTGVYLTENASKILGLKTGDTAYIQKLDLTQEMVTISSLVKNYLGNNIYMSQTAYEEVFGAYEPNGILAKLSDTCEDQIAFSDQLAEENWILSSVSTQDLKENFSQAFTLINIVVYVVLVLAACLAFVVLFTLANVNISERERELATIKVLGFYDKEVHSYVNKETLILTAMGILIGLPLGAGLSSMLTDILNMPSIYFEVTIYNRSFFLAAGIALGFAFIVQFLTDRSLNAIDPVEALKSVE